MVQCMVGKGDEDNRFDLVVEEYPEQFLSCVTLGSYSAHIYIRFKQAYLSRSGRPDKVVSRASRKA